MKKLCLAILLGLALFCLVYDLGYAGTKTLTFAWNQTLPSPNDLRGWGLYQAPTAGGTYTKIMDILYVSPQTEYTTTTVITVTDNQVTTLYFVLDAVDTSGNRSPRSNEVFVTIDFQPPGAPIQLRVTVTTP